MTPSARTILLAYFSLISAGLLCAETADQKIEKALSVVKMGQRLPTDFFNHIDLDTLLAQKKKSPKAQFLLATLYAWGHGEIAPDFKKAEAFYDSSATAGFAKAQSGLGDFIRERQILKRSSAEALEWQLKAAEQKDPWAYACLALLYGQSSKTINTGAAEMEKWMQLAYDSGDKIAIGRVQWLEGYNTINGRMGRERDWVKGVEFLEKGVANGSPKAMQVLGFVTGGGQVVKKDLIKAHQLTSQAAELGNPVAVMILGKVYMVGAGVEKDSDRAVKLYIEASQMGNSMAMMKVSELYEKGELVPQDNESALYWLRMAAASGATLNAVYELGQCYEQGRLGLKKDLAKAIELYEEAAGLKIKIYRPAVDRLASLHMGHDQGEKNIKEALKWLHISKNRRAKYDLACLYRDGEIVERDLDQAFKNFLVAAKRNHQGAIKEVVKAYETGRGLPKDPKQARRWRKKLKK